MGLFAALRRGRNSHAARKRVKTYLVTTLMVVLTTVVPAGTLTAQAAGLNHSAPSAQQTSGRQAQAVFTTGAQFSLLKPRNHSVVAPIDPLCSQLGITPPGHPIKVGVSGVPASVSYDVRWWNETGGNSIVVASGNTTSSGTFLTSFQVPAEPPGYYKLIVEIASQPIGLDAIYFSEAYTCFTYHEREDGFLHWQWDGVGWDANSTVHFNFNGIQIHQATADTQGSFGIDSFKRGCPPSGTYPGTISGTVDGQPVSIPFNPPVTVDGNCLGCVPHCAPSGSSTIDGGVLEARPMIKLSH